MPKTAQRPDLAVCIPVWKRPRIVKIVLAQWAYIRGVFRERYTIQLFCGISRKDDRKPLPEWVTAVDVENEPLNEKHNRLVQRAAEHDPRCVMHVNSDDLFTPQYIRRALESMESYDVVRLRDFAFLDMETRSVRFSYEALPGSGTAMNRFALDRLRATPWYGPPLNTQLDTRLYQNLNRAGVSMRQFQTTPESAMQGLSLKSDTNIWSFEEHLALIQRAGGDVAPVSSSYVGHHFPAALPLINSYISDDQDEDRRGNHPPKSANGARGDGG